MRSALKILVSLMLFATSAKAFSLLGPYQDWMQVTNGYRLLFSADYNDGVDIGGPMDLDEEYRWNVPVLTYAFDQSFLDYFGSNGVTAVEGAIQMLNDLPPASNILLSNYPNYSLVLNAEAQSHGSHRDLKSFTLAMLLQHMGLAPPSRHVFTLHQGADISSLYGDPSIWPTNTIPNLVLMRNFDPETLQPSLWVNGVIYWCQIYFYPIGVFSENESFTDVFEFPIDPTTPSFTSVADKAMFLGEIFSSLTADDVGGWRYLYRSNNINYEKLLPDVRGANPAAYVDGAWRPGIEKITFIRQEYDLGSGQAIPLTNQFVDTYVTNGVVTQQTLERVITEPDFLFTVTNAPYHPVYNPRVTRTDCRNWRNHAAFNGNPANAGPGTIIGPVRIAYKKIGTEVYTFGRISTLSYDASWASYDTTTNPPIYYPSESSSRPTSLPGHFAIFPLVKPYSSLSYKSFVWDIPAPFGNGAHLQTSTNLNEWTTLITVTNQGNELNWRHSSEDSTRFFRAVPQ